ncbi:hypothetical protein Hanom_Chr14g01260171 [Helianthus anomalus]
MTSAVEGYLNPKCYMFRPVDEPLILQLQGSTRCFQMLLIRSSHLLVHMSQMSYHNNTLGS